MTPPPRKPPRKSSTPARKMPAAKAPAMKPAAPGKRAAKKSVAKQAPGKALPDKKSRTTPARRTPTAKPAPTMPKSETKPRASAKRTTAATGAVIGVLTAPGADLPAAGEAVAPLLAAGVAVRRIPSTNAAVVSPAARAAITQLAKHKGAVVLVVEAGNSAALAAAAAAATHLPVLRMGAAPGVPPGAEWHDYAADGPAAARAALRFLSITVPALRGVKVPPPPGPVLVHPAEKPPAATPAPAAATATAPSPAASADAAGVPLEYTAALRRAVSGAAHLAIDFKHEAIAPGHLLCAMLDSPSAASEILAKQATRRMILHPLHEHLSATMEQAPASGTLPVPHRSLQALLTVARMIARRRRGRFLATTDVLQAIFAVRGPEADVLSREVRDKMHLIAAITNTTAPVAEEDATAPSARRDVPVPPPLLDQGRIRELSERLDRANPAPPRPPAAVVSMARPAPENTAAPEPPPTPRKLRICPFDVANPAVETVEEAADCLLERHLILMPTDTGAVVAADATSPAAVASLQSLLRDAERPLTLLAHSRLLVRQLLAATTAECEALMEHIWPGPVTIVFPAARGAQSVHGPERTLGVRIPDHYGALAVLSMLQRPVAVASVERILGAVPETLAEAAAALAPRVVLALDSREPLGGALSTVVSITANQPAILREGAVSIDTIRRALREGPTGD